MSSIQRTILGDGALTLNDVRGQLQQSGFKSRNGSTTQSTRTHALARASMMGADYWHITASMTTAVHSPANFTVEGFLYAIGGEIPGAFPSLANTSQQYNDTLNAWTNKAQMAAPRTRAESFVLAGDAYVAHGHTAALTATMERYDHTLNTWTSLANATAAYRVAAAYTIGGRAYVAGGFLSAEQSTHVEYNPITDSWRILTSLNAVRGWPGAWELNEYGYVVGGRQNGSTMALDVDKYDVVTNTWQTSGTLPIPQAFVASYKIAGQGYLAGGSATPALSDTVDTNQCYDPTTNNWKQKTKQITGTRFNREGSDHNENGYVTGGLAISSIISTVQQYTAHAMIEIGDYSIGAVFAPLHVDVGVTINGVAEAYPVHLSTDGGATWVRGNTRTGFEKTGLTMSQQLAVSGFGARRIQARIGIPSLFVDDPSGMTWSTKALKLAKGWGSTAASLSGLNYTFFQFLTANSNAAEKYNPASDSWSVAPSRSGTARRGEGHTTLRNQGYFMAGFTSVFVNNVDRFDPNLGVYITRANYPALLFNPAVDTIYDRIYAATGRGASVSLTNTAYQSEADLWLVNTNIPTARDNPMGGGLDGVFYVIAGNSGSTRFNLNEAYDIVTDTWSTKGVHPLLTDTITQLVFSNRLMTGPSLPAAGGNSTVYEYKRHMDLWLARPVAPAQTYLNATGYQNGAAYISGGIDVAGGSLATDFHFQLTLVRDTVLAAVTLRMEEQKNV